MKKHTRTNGDHQTVARHAKSLIAATSIIADANIDNARQKLAEVIETAKDGLDYVEESVAEGASRTDEFVRKNPYQAVGLGVGIGLVLGLYLCRRR